MLLQTNSYIVPKDKRAQHARLVHRFRQTLTRLGCDHFEAYEQVGANWSPADTTGRFVQLMRFRDRKQQLAVQAAERNDATAQALIKEFCELINFPYQQQQGLFAVGFYHSLLPTTLTRTENGEISEAADEAAGDTAISESEAIEQVTGSPEPGEPAKSKTLEASREPSEPLAVEATGDATGDPMDVDQFLAEDSLSDLELSDEIEGREIELNEEHR